MRHSKVSTWEAKCAALEIAFRGLPIRRATGVGISYEFLIPDISRQLMLMIPNPRVRIARTGEDLRAVPLSILPTEDGLKRLAQSTGRTVKTLDGLSQTALDALNYKSAALRELTTKIRILQAAAEVAGDEIAKAKEAKVKAGRGRPPKVEPSPAQKIARVVAQHYRGLTGDEAKAPTRLIRLLCEVYRILGIEARARSQLESRPE